MFELAFIAQPIVDACNSVLHFWHDLIGSWGVAIILLTFTIRLLILPLTFSSVRSMQKLQVLQPQIKEIQARFKEDKQRMNQEMMKFYQENKVNPLGSCLPLLLQIPFFISLFHLLKSSDFKDDLGSEKSFLFIHDLSATLTHQPVVLALMIVLYVGTQLIASLITSMGGDKTQQRIMLALPFVFAVFIINFPAGLILYWITTNVWTIGQQLVVRRLYPKPDPNAVVAAGSVSTPARGKPVEAAAIAAPETKPKRKAKSTAKGKDKADASNGAKTPPPQSPRRKKKRSGRRR
jgi:YidC/Oxa1 family membrane protein insertase